MATTYNGKFKQVEALYIKGQEEPIKDCAVFFLDNFVIVATDQNETAPTWYNINIVEKLEGVTAETYKGRIGAY